MPKFLGGPNPSLHLLFPSLPFTFASPLIPLPSPFPLPLEAGPLNTARGMGSVISSHGGVWGGTVAESEVGAFWH